MIVDVTRSCVVVFGGKGVLWCDFERLLVGFRGIGRVGPSLTIVLGNCFRGFGDPGPTCTAVDSS